MPASSLLRRSKRKFASAFGCTAVEPGLKEGDDVVGPPAIEINVGLPSSWATSIQSSAAPTVASAAYPQEPSNNAPQRQSHKRLMDNHDISTPASMPATVALEVIASEQGHGTNFPNKSPASSASLLSLVALMCMKGPESCNVMQYVALLNKLRSEIAASEYVKLGKTVASHMLRVLCTAQQVCPFYFRFYIHR